MLARLEASGLTGMGGAGFPTWRKWDAVRREPGAARRDRQRRRGRAGHDQGPLRDGAPAAAPARRARGRDALLRDRRGLHLPARGVRDLARGAAGGDRGARAPGRARDRCRRVHLRRGDGDAGVDGGPARDAAAAAAVPGPVRLPRPADADQQRRDARPRRADPARRLAAGAALVGLRRGREPRLLRGAARHHAPRADRRVRRRPHGRAGRDRPRRRRERDPAARRARHAADARGARRVGLRRRLRRRAGLPERLLAAPPARGDDALLRRGVVPEVHAVPDRQPRAPRRLRGRADDDAATRSTSGSRRWR